MDYIYLYVILWYFWFVNTYIHLYNMYLWFFVYLYHWHKVVYGNKLGRFWERTLFGMYKWWIFRWNVTLAEGKYDSLHVSRKTPHKSQVLFSAKIESIHSENNIRLEQKLGLNQQWDLSSRKGIKLQDVLAPRITELFIFPPSWKWSMVTFNLPSSGSS